MITVQTIEQYFGEHGIPDFVVCLSACSRVTPELAPTFIDNNVGNVLRDPVSPQGLQSYEDLVRYYTAAKAARDILNEQANEPTD